MNKVGVIGGGAAGFFAAIHVKENYPESTVVILEKSSKVLAKVKVSGGGRCNVTNGTTSIKDLSSAYPRGGKALKKAFTIWNTKHTMEWFEQRGVPLIIQEDNCVFPVSQDSQTIIDCFQNEIQRLQIKVEMGKGVKKIIPNPEGLTIEYLSVDHKPESFDKIIVATGGSPRRPGLQWLEDLGHKIENPVPSLFTFNMPDENIRELMGIVVEETQTNIQGTKLKSDGPLLITHWGMSGPSILKLSAFGARILSGFGYKFKVQVNWVNESNYEIVKSQIDTIIQENPNKQVSNFRPYGLKERLWLFLIDKCEINPIKKWSELGKRDLNKIVNILSNDIYQVEGKTTFKEEFVTCGGVSLESIDFKTMQSKVCKNLYFAGEVMDIDGITGGYNFQSAWTTAYIAAQLKD